MKNNKTTVSFDFDGTLNDYFMGEINPHKDWIRALFIELVTSDDFDVYIITRRHGPERSEEGSKNEHEKVFELINELNIEFPKEKILFTNRDYKYSYINKLKVDIHLDDEDMEHQLISKFSNGRSVDVTQPNWREKFDELL